MADVLICLIRQTDKVVPFFFIVLVVLISVQMYNAKPYGKVVYKKCERALFFAAGCNRQISGGNFFISGGYFFLI
jgi:hypothetical protein